LTYGERRKRADSKQILNDFEELESAFLSFAQKLNVKRQAQLKKRINKLLPELRKAHSEGDIEEVEGILKSLTMPSSKEWRKGLEKLVYSATRSGILRAFLEVERLKELYQFDEHWEVVSEGYDYDVVIPETAREFIKKHSYELGVITEDTALERIRKELEDGLDEGLSPKEMTDRINQVTDTWVSEWHAQTIARTETGKFYNAGRIASWTDPELDGFVEAMQYDAIVDTRTTSFCRHMDGKIIDIRNQAMIAEYTPPNHFQCRATWIPVSRYEVWEDDFTVGEEPEKGFSFQSPTPFLVNGKTQPLVQKRKKPKVLTAKDIETYTDARKWGEQNFLDLELDELPLDLVQEIAERVENVFDKVPVLQGFLESLKDTPQNIRRGGKWQGEYAHAWIVSKGVSFNPKIYNNRKDLYESYERDLSYKFHPENTDASSIVTHELGHIFEYWLRSKGYTTKPTQKDWGSYAKQIRKDALKATGIKVKDIGDNLSNYGKTNPSEFFAEAFSEWLDSPSPRPIAKAVGVEVTRLMNEIIEEENK
jgi:SPP1 gp7 family putative phage head morphogenesis protein